MVSNMTQVRRAKNEVVLSPKAVERALIALPRRTAAGIKVQVRGPLEEHLLQGKQRPNRAATT